MTKQEDPEHISLDSTGGGCWAGDDGEMGGQQVEYSILQSGRGGGTRSAHAANNAGLTLGD